MMLDLTVGVDAREEGGRQLK